MFLKLLSHLRSRLSNLLFHESYGFCVVDPAGRVVTPRGHDRDGYLWTPNRVVDQGLNYALNAALRADGVISAWYLAPFAGNVTPNASVTASNFASTLTEFTNYDEPNRVAWVPDGAATAGVIVNNTTPAVFTIGSGPQDSIYGAGLLSAQAKGATTGVCFSAGRLQGGSGLLNLQEGYEVRLKYRITASSS